MTRIEFALYQRARRAKLRLAGKCPQCQAPSVDRYKCQRCRDREKEIRVYR